MTNDALLIVGTTLSECFKFFTSWHIPGTNFTPAQFFFGVVTIVFFFKWFKALFAGLESGDNK